MEKITLIELKFQKIKIPFHKGLNYIRGSNGSGKTTIYNLIQFVLGVRKEINKDLFKFDYSSPISLLCNIGSTEVLITRNINSEYLTFEYGTDKYTVKSMSSHLKKIYDDLFNPYFVLEKEEGAAYDILKYSFLSELRYDISLRGNDVFKKILGVNVSYMKQANNDYRNLKDIINNEKNSFVLLDSFVKNIIKMNDETNKLDKVNLKELLEIQYKSMLKKHLVNVNFLNDAQNAINNNKEFLDEYLDRRISLIEPYFLNLITSFGLGPNSVYFRDLFNSRHSFKNKHSSGSTIYTQLLCFMIALCRRGYDDKHNGCGLLISDMSHSMYDYPSNQKLEEIIRNEKNLDSLQYIEFTVKQSKEISFESFDLDSVEKFI